MNSLVSAMDLVDNISVHIQFKYPEAVYIGNYLSQKISSDLPLRKWHNTLLRGNEWRCFGKILVIYFQRYKNKVYTISIPGI